MTNNNGRVALIQPQGGSSTTTSCKCGGNCRCATTKRFLQPDMPGLNVVDLLDNAQPGCVLRQVEPGYVAETHSLRS